MDQKKVQPEEGVRRINGVSDHQLRQSAAVGTQQTRETKAAERKKKKRKRAEETHGGKLLLINCNFHACMKLLMINNERNALLNRYITKYMSFLVNTDKMHTQHVRRTSSQTR